MMFAGASFSASALASQTALSTATTDAEAGAPLDISLNNVSWREWIKVESLQIDDTLGEQVTCNFTIVNPDSVPVVGDVVRVRYFSQILFAGTIDRITRKTNNTLTYRTFDCTCSDWSQILIRSKIRRNFINIPLPSIVSSLLDNELAGEGLTMGTFDLSTTLPLVDSRGGSAFDVLRDAAGITGQTFYVDFDKAIQFRVTSNDAAPILFDTDHIEDADLKIDRETYRNVQTVIVTGTPASESSTDAIVVTEERQNDDQIAARAAIEGGTGRYESVEEVTHPTSNLTAECQLLGIGYANLRLATSGVLRQTLTARARSYGFRAGQFATATLPSLGVSGTWLIQRVSLHDEAGKRLIHELELVQSSLQQRAYESWLRIVSGGKITVQMPGSITSNSVTYTTSPSPWTVPAGVTSITVTCVGGSGGGAGDISYFNWGGSSCIWVTPKHPAHGNGGTSGKAISIISVTAGQTVTIVVGIAGTPGLNGETDLYGTCNPFYEGPTTDGVDGTQSSVTISGVIVCQGDGGGGGKTYANGGADGSSGSGIGDAVTVGGGRTGGIKGLLGDATHAHGPAPYPIAPTVGSDGYVEIAW